MSEPIDIKLAKIEQIVTDGFDSTARQLEDIIKRNERHDVEDNLRFGNLGERIGRQSDRISDLDKKVVYATGIVIGACFVLKFFIH